MSLVTATGSSSPAISVRPAHGSAEKVYFPAFDWWRWILASYVCLYHFDVLHSPRAGELAVHMFFALSGWLIGGILVRSEPRNLPRFFFDRGTRIWIPFALCIGLFYTVAAFDRIDFWWARGLLIDATLTHNLFACSPDCQTVLAHMPLKATAQHFWTISAEEQFYLFAPFVMMYLPVLGRSGLFWLAAGGIASHLLMNASAISFGVAAAIFAYRRPAVFMTIRARVAMGTALAALVALLIVDDSIFPYISPTAAALIILLSAVPGPKSKIGAFLGGTSYPFYLNHWIGIFAAHAIQKIVPIPNKTVVGLVGYAIALGFASVLYVAVDRQILTRRRAYFTVARGRVFLALAVVLYAVGCVGGLTMNRLAFPLVTAAIGTDPR